MNTYWKTVRGYCQLLDEERSISIEVREFLPLGSSHPAFKKCCYKCSYEECPLPTCPIYESADFQ